MGDILVGLVLDIIDGELLEVEIESVDVASPGGYGAREYVRVTEGGWPGGDAAAFIEASALLALTYQEHRVRVVVESRDDQGRILGVIEIFDQADVIGLPHNP